MHRGPFANCNDEVAKGRGSIGWKKNGLNGWTTDGGIRGLHGRIEDLKCAVDELYDFIFHSTRWIDTVQIDSRIRMLWWCSVVLKFTNTCMQEARAGKIGDVIRDVKVLVQN